MIEVNIMTHDFITYEIALKQRKLKCKYSKPSCEYFYKVSQIWCFCSDERYDESYE